LSISDSLDPWNIWLRFIRRLLLFELLTFSFSRDLDLSGDLEFLRRSEMQPLAGKVLPCFIINGLSQTYRRPEVTASCLSVLLVGVLMMFSNF